MSDILQGQTTNYSQIIENQLPLKNNNQKILQKNLQKH